MLKKTKKEGIFFILIILLLFLERSTSLELEVPFNIELNGQKTSFFIKNSGECNDDPFDSGDFMVPPLIDEYTYIFSRYDQHNVSLSVDCWDPLKKQNKNLSLTYRVVSPANETGTIYFFWNPEDFIKSQYRLNLFLVDLKNEQRINLSSKTSASFPNSQRERNFSIESYFEGCGDGVINFNEHCDNENLNGKSCVSLGYSGGNLSCNKDTCRFDLRGCYDEEGKHPSEDGNGGGRNNEKKGITCINECKIKERKCFSKNSFKVCGDFNSDNCTEWGEEEKCLGINPFCDKGFCYGCLSDGDCKEGFCVNGKCETNCNKSCEEMGLSCGKHLFCGKIVDCGNCSSKGFCNNGKCSSLPEKAVKTSDRDCKAEYICTPWSECKVNYIFEKVLLGDMWFSGKKQRMCFDKNKCYSTIKEEELCALKREILVKEVNLCEKKYIEIYDKKTNELLARIVDSRYSEKSLMEIFLLPTRSFLCEKERENYKISWFDRVMWFLDLRKILGFVNEK